MQFIWKYIDDLVGKGLEWYIILELLFYTSATLVPMALPLSILLSSIMTFGNLAEKYELAALKASGVSLQRVMRPLIWVSVILCFVAFLFSNYLLPIANLKMGSLLYDVRQQKPALDIKEGIFYSQIDGYTIRIAKKSKDSKDLTGVMIYDHTEKVGANKLIIAKKGRMEMSKDERYLLVNLKDGNSYEEVKPGSVSQTGSNKFPFMRTQFSEQLIRFDLMAFKMSRTDEDMFKDNFQMLNLKQLDEGIDTMHKEIKLHKIRIKDQIIRNIQASPSSLDSSIVKVFKDTIKFKYNNFISNFKKEEQLKIYETASNIARSNSSYLVSSQTELELYADSVNRYRIEWNKKFTLSFACIILFFVGAPLGAIIKKGGLGMPVVVSVCFFLVFHVLSIMGEKFAKEGVVPAYQGIWLASAVLLPIGVFLTYKATADSTLFDMENYISFFKRILKKKKK